MSMVTKRVTAAGREEPHPVDVAVGLAIRVRRKAMGLSQEALAEALDISFQQVQKYEKGSNRISASKLFDTAKFLKAPIELFFRSIDSADVGGGFQVSEGEQAVQQFLMTPEGVALAQSFPRITKASVRRRVLDLAKTLAED
ncbi:MULTISPECIES: helix-turn-helix domain-containing protein [Asticcacaulis]|uniref:helix-turn-helix domain-containing protein n=1 Tax=Asticcacaulis TaxID=76890 RepID=UPI001FD95AFE|nr:MULTISPECIES: helix-turn-helix transcriptional regulator [Asticcacaulis]MBP2159080.1 transcriptional regulator with XRE-family HTH domain [Asticcacaulis solisilvae]MDR6800125.1 transcriptional regulator with XRE-family HTH domain [Asticcacaulis sp. BE141]